MEFCRLCEVFPGFTPSLVAELTMPQFLLYARYANDQKRIQLNLDNVNDYLNMILGGKSTKKSPEQKRGTFAEIADCKNDFQNKINNIGNIALAKQSLIEKTGRKEFGFGEIIKEIARLDKDKAFKYKIQ